MTVYSHGGVQPCTREDCGPRGSYIPGWRLHDRVHRVGAVVVRHDAHQRLGGGHGPADHVDVHLVHLVWGEGVVDHVRGAYLVHLADGRWEGGGPDKGGGRDMMDS